MHPPNGLPQSLIQNYVEVNGNRLSGSVGLLCRDNPLQIDDYLPEIIMNM